MKLIKALQEWKFTFTETEHSFENLKHCWEVCTPECVFPWMHIIDCPKCDTRLTIKELIWECFVWSKK